MVKHVSIHQNLGVIFPNSHQVYYAIIKYTLYQCAISIPKLRIPIPIPNLIMLST